jgi:hypothetical protein
MRVSDPVAIRANLHYRYVAHPQGRIMGKTPLNIKLGVEYSVVSEDTYGKRTAFRVQITPVIPSAIKDPIFGK